MGLIRYIWTMGAFFVYMAYAPFFSRKASRLKGTEKENYIRLHVGRWGRRALEWVDNEVTVSGMENLPEKGPYIIVANHRSMLDVPLVQGYVNPHAGFLAKKELGKFFSVGKFLTVLGGEMIDRNNPRDAVRALNNLMKRMRDEGQVVALFPEGTRSTDREVHEFKGGSLKLITKSLATVVPMAIVGTDDCMPKGSFYMRAAKVRLSILPPVEPSKLADEDMKNLSGFLRDMISEEVKRLEEGGE